MAIEKRIHAWHRSSEESRRLEEIPGVGPIVAAALVAEVGNWKVFSSGRSLPAWIGLVPRQHSTGGKERLGKILALEDKRFAAMIGGDWKTVQGLAPISFSTPTPPPSPTPRRPGSNR